MKGKSLTLIGTAITLALTSNVAVGQSSKSPIDESSNSSITSPTEIKLSPEGMKILCEHFPLNSRCPGGTAINSSSPSNTKIPFVKPAQENTNSESTIVPTDPTSPESGNPENLNPVPVNPTSKESGNSSNLTPAPVSPTEPGASSPSQVPDTSLPQTSTQGS
ncbi:hypothetical protein [Cylindrospermum sp. FACHB-282]|uniref:hypothetical protein n=1 Tax=Cylindrospermum sp. FACHB-282 TaxID=2692794 RepID=UPI0016828EFC|nr:hypothetical protein [Cylindrospermum sp. FACHB-282]MBD2387352.1 hypothetical protein [Cylindrospermum sp. FACHB-282]